MRERELIRRTVAYYIKLCGTRDPFEIADQIGVLYQFGKSKYEGCYMYLKKHKYIFLNDQLDGPLMDLVMAHELGHALMDPKLNCYFIRNKTIFLASRPEIRANTFAAYLLIADEQLRNFTGYTRDQFVHCTGYPKELIELRLK